ncbi:hypothetical protein D3C76_1073760 [compost metagenome]
MQHFGHDNTDHQAQANCRCRPLLKTPEHREIKICAEGREPFTPATPATGLLIFSDAAVTRVEAADAVKQILVG